MKLLAVDICPTRTSGLCNQMYSIAAAIVHCFENKINLLFLNKFLKSINTERYCNISEIIDLNKLNLLSQKYNVHIIDFNNYNFTVEQATIKYKSNTKNITKELVDLYYLKNNFKVKKDTQFFFENSYDENLTLTIKYKLDTYFFIENYLIKNNKLTEDINYDFNTNLKFQKCWKSGDSYLFNKFLSLIPFTNEISINSFILNKNLLKNNKSIKKNVIHLRIEDDILVEYSTRLSIDKEIYRQKLENKYIHAINYLMNKDDLNIILTYSTENSVINYLKDNNYNYLISDIKSEDREISAIYDCLLGENSNNNYLFVYESSFSYFLLTRIKNNTEKSYQIYLLDLDKDIHEVLFLY